MKPSTCSIHFFVSKLALLTIASVFLVAASPLAAKNKDPVIIEVFADLDANELHIIGENFDEPKVRLGNYSGALNVISDQAEDLLIVELPDDLLPGSYLLEVENKKANKSNTFDLTIAVSGNGGGSGEPGLTGLQGEVARTRPQGEAGPAGPQGEAGAVGPQGPVGPQGIAGAKGDKGDKGDRGDAGQQGSSGIIQAAYVSDPVLAPAAELAFISAVAKVLIEGEGHSAFINATAALGTTLDNVLPLNIYPCYEYQDEEGGNSGMKTLGGGMWGLAVPQNTRTTMSISAVLKEAAPGSYRIGMCGLVPGQDATDEAGDPIDTQWDNNDFSYVSVLVFE